MAKQYTASATGEMMIRQQNACNNISHRMKSRFHQSVQHDSFKQWE
tara:strand:+ start:47150 stop:47287 length:138 start_codon:yes stop_codon:yes gene_type:complete